MSQPKFQLVQPPQHLLRDRGPLKYEGRRLPSNGQRLPKSGTYHPRAPLGAQVESITDSCTAGKFGPGADFTSLPGNPPPLATDQGAHSSDIGADVNSVGPSRPSLQLRAAHGTSRTQPAYVHAPVSAPSGSKPTAWPSGKPAAAPQHTGLDAVQMSLQDMLAAAARIQNEFLTSSQGARAPPQELPRAASGGIEQQPRAVARPKNRGPLEALRDELFADLTLSGPAAAAPAALPPVANSAATTASQSPVIRRTSWNNDAPGITALPSGAGPTEQGTNPPLQEELSTTLTAQAGHSYADLSSIYSIPDSTLNAVARTPMSFTTAAVSELDTPSSARSRDEEYDKSVGSPRSSPQLTGRYGSGRRQTTGRTEYDKIASGYDDYVSPASWMSLREQHSTSYAMATSTSAPGFGGGGDGAGSVTSTPTGPSAWASRGIDLVGSMSTAAPPSPPVSPVASTSSVTYAAADTDAVPTPKARPEAPLLRHPSRGSAKQHQHQPEQSQQGRPPTPNGARPDIVGLVVPPPLSLPSDNSLGAALASSPSSGGPPTTTGFGSIVIAAGPDSGRSRERTSSGQLYRTLSFGVPSGAPSIISSGTVSRSGEDGAGAGVAIGVNAGASQPSSGQVSSHRSSAVGRTSPVGPRGVIAGSRLDTEHGGGPGSRYGDDPHHRYAEITFTNPLFVRDGESSHGGLEGSSMGGGGGTSSSADGSAEGRGGKVMAGAVTPPPSAREGAPVSRTGEAEPPPVMEEAEPPRRGVKRGMGLEPALATAAAERTNGLTSHGGPGVDTVDRRLVRTNSDTAAVSQAATDIAGLSSATSGTDTDGNGHLPPLDPGRPPSVTATLVPVSPPPAAAIGRPLAMANSAAPPSPPVGTSWPAAGDPGASAEPIAPGLGVSAATLIAVPEQDRGELVRSWAQVRADFASRPQGSGSQGGATSSTPLTPEPSNSGVAPAAGGMAGQVEGDASETEHSAKPTSTGPFGHPEVVPLAPQRTAPKRPLDSSDPTAASPSGARAVSVRAVTAAEGDGTVPESRSSTLQHRQPHASDPTPPGGNQLDRLLALLSGRGARSEGHDQLLMGDTLRSAVFDAVSQPRPNSAPVLVSFETVTAAAATAHEVSGKLPPPLARRGSHPVVAIRGLDAGGEPGASGGRDAEDAGAAVARSLGRGSVGSGLPEHPHPHREPHLPLKPHAHPPWLHINQHQHQQAQQPQAAGAARAPAQAATPSVPPAQLSARAQSTSPSGSLCSVDSELAAERLKAKMRAYIQGAEAAAAGQAGQGDLAPEISSEASSGSALAVGVQQPRQHPVLQDQAPGSAAPADSSIAAAAAAVIGLAALPVGQDGLAAANEPYLNALLRRAAQHLQAATDPAAAATGAVQTSLVALEDILRQLHVLARSNSAGSGGAPLATAAGPAALPPRPPAVALAAEVKPADDADAGDELNQLRSSGGGGSGEVGGSISVGGFSGTSAGSTGGRGGEWSGEGQRMASSVGSVSLWAGSAGTGSTAAAPSRVSRAVSSPSRLGLQAAGTRAAEAAASHAHAYPPPPPPADTSPYPLSYLALYPGPHYDAPPANKQPGALMADRRKDVSQDRPERIHGWAQLPGRASAPAVILNARGGGGEVAETGGGAAEGTASYLELASHAAKLREQMEGAVRQSPPRPTRPPGGRDEEAAQRLLLSPPYSDVVADDSPRQPQAGPRHSQPGGSPQARTQHPPAVQSSYAAQHPQQDWYPGGRSASLSGEAAVFSKPPGPVDWQAALQSKLLPYDAVRDRDMLIASEELPVGLFTADAAPATGAGRGPGDGVHRGARNSAGGRQASRPASPRAIGARSRPSSARASAPSAAGALRSAPVSPRRGNSPARSSGPPAVGGSDASWAAGSGAATLPSQHGPAPVNFGNQSKSPRAGSNVRDGRARSGNSGSILDRATPRGQGWGTAGSSAGIPAGAAGAGGGVGGGSHGGAGAGSSPQPTRSPSPAHSEPIVIVRPFAWQERETRNWLEDMGLLVNSADEALPLLDNPLRNGLLLAVLAARLVGTPLPAGVVTEPPRDMRSARTNILCALDHLGMLAAPWAPPPDAERRARAQAAAADLAAAAGAASGGGPGSNGGASGARSRSPSPSRNNASGPTTGSSGIIAIKALGSAGRGYALRLKERQLRAGLGLVAEVESVLAGSPDSIWGLLNFIRLAIAPQYQYLRGSGAGAGPGGVAGGRQWGHGAGGETQRRTFDVRGGLGPDGMAGLGPAPAALAAAATTNGGHATSRSGKPSPSRGAGTSAADAGTEGGSNQQAGRPEGTPTLRGGKASTRSKIPTGPIADPRGSMQFTSSLSQIPAAPSAGGGGVQAVPAHESGLLYRPLWPQLTSLPYSPAELAALESSLLQWLMESGAISRLEAVQGFPALLRMFEDGTFICWLVSNLSGKPIVGAHRRPLTEAARRTNWLKAIEALRTTPGMSRRFLVYEEALIHCERPPLTGLLEDLHRLAGGLPPAPSAILPDAKPYLPYAVPEPDVRTLPPDRIAINRGSPSASPRPASPTPGRHAGNDPSSRRGTTSPSPRATPSRHRRSGLLSNAAGIALGGETGGAGTSAPPAPPPSPPLAAAPHLLHPLFLRAVPGPPCHPSSAAAEHASGHGSQASGRDEQGGEGVGGGASARGESPVRNARRRSGGAVTAASGVRRATAVSDASSGGVSGAIVRSLITDIMVTPTKVSPAAAAGPWEAQRRRQQRLSSSTSIDLLRASYPVAAWGAEVDLGSEAHQHGTRNKRNHSQQQNSQRPQQQQQRGRTVLRESRSAGGAAEGSPAYAAAVSPRLRLVPSGY